MGRFEQARQNIRRAYETGRESVRAARQRAEQPNDEPLMRMAHQPALPEHATAPGAQGPVSEESAAGPPAPPGPEPPPTVEEAVPRSLRIAGAWSWRLIVVSAVAYALLWIANQYLLLVAPLMIGLLLAGLLMPAQRGLVKLHVHRSLAALLVVVAGLAAVGGTLYLVVNAFIAGLPGMISEVESGIGEFQDWLENGPVGLTEDNLEDLVTQAQDWINENTQQLTDVGLAAVTGTVQFLTGMVLTLVITFFFLRDGGRIWRFMISMLPPPARAPMAYAGEGGWRALGGYVRATVMVAFVDALGIGLGLYILDLTMGMPFVLPLAALVFLGGFVPIVGAFVSGGVAVLVALISPPGTEGLIKGLIVLGIVVLVQQLESNVLQPFIVSKMVRIHPLAVIIAVTAGILLAGIMGALVAVPIVAVLNAVVRRLNSYRDERFRREAEPGAPPGPAQDPPPRVVTESSG
ncbi:AI-2E family transporter [Natronosporangium hydrolyticum]|uniref:AI-2E family transporter n=1 Tax=Natronosporangium hydrolyticum TaxID=2811111 RepID=A0A895YMH9_9ACTN|nr:AI-2E family transporter [Natronosporangium hydrolyticum]